MKKKEGGKKKAKPVDIWQDQSRKRRKDTKTKIEWKRGNNCTYNKYFKNKDNFGLIGF